jgi:hypothetical protein
LQPLGEDELAAAGDALSKLGIPIKAIETSPFDRCSTHGKIWADKLNVTNTPTFDLNYMANWREQKTTTPDLVGASKMDSNKYSAWQLRRILGTEPPVGTNKIYITHGFNIKWATSAASDEG